MGCLPIVTGGWHDALQEDYSEAEGDLAAYDAVGLADYLSSTFEGSLPPALAEALVDFLDASGTQQGAGYVAVKAAPLAAAGASQDAQERVLQAVLRVAEGIVGQSLGVEQPLMDAGLDSLGMQTSTD